MTHRNTSKTRGKTPVEILLGRRVRLPAIADFDLCEPIAFKANERQTVVPATFIIRKGLNTSRKLSTDYSSERQPNCETRQLNQQWRRPYLNQNNNSRTQMWDLHFKMKLLQPHHLKRANNPKPRLLHEHQKETENNPTDLENLYTQTCLKKEGGWDGFKETSRNLEVFY